MLTELALVFVCFCHLHNKQRLLFMNCWKWDMRINTKIPWQNRKIMRHLKRMLLICIFLSRTLCHSAHWLFAQGLNAQLPYTELILQGYVCHDLSLPPFTSLPYCDRQLVSKWRTKKMVIKRSNSNQHQCLAQACGCYYYWQHKIVPKTCSCALSCKTSLNI